MRQGQGPNNRRPRGRHHGGGHGGHDRGDRGGNGGNVVNPNRGDNRPRSASSLRHQNFDSNCIDLRVRGNAWQVHEKYQALARDAQSAGDRVSAENYLQHAEHYFRIIEAIEEATASEQRQAPRVAGMPGVPGAPAAGAVVSGSPPLPFAQQPETPTNYYGTDGRPSGAPPLPSAADGATNGNVTSLAGQGQAEVQVRNPHPPQNNPFFADEAEAQNSGPQSLVARR